MVTRVLSVGLLAGILAGLLIAVLQQVTTTPLILRAETYERQQEAASATPSVRRDGYDMSGGMSLSKYGGFW